MNNIQTAKTLFKEGDYTCVLVNGEDVVTSTEDGIKPLVGYLDDDKDYSGYSAADKVVGRAAAFLYVKLNVKGVWAKTMSREGRDILDTFGISTFYEELTPKIMNRVGDDICPMDKALVGVVDPDPAAEILKEKVASM